MKIAIIIFVVLAGCGVGYFSYRCGVKRDEKRMAKLRENRGEDKIQRLLAYNAEFGCFPKAKEMDNDANLGAWYKKQKMALRDQVLSRNKLPEDKIQKLEEVGLVLKYKE